MDRIPSESAGAAEQLYALGEFAARPPYPVHGLHRPVLMPARLARWETRDGETVAVQLVYGELQEPGAAFLAVTTRAPGSAVERADLLGELRRERLLERGSWSQPEYQPLPAGPAAVGEVCRVGRVWALALRSDGQAVTVLGRGVEPLDVETGPVRDLRPYLGGQSRLVRLATAEPWARPEPELAPAHGIAAVRAFLETFLPGAPDAGPAYRALGRRAVTELDRALGCGVERAERLIASLVGQLAELRRQVPWFTEPDGPRTAALEELLRHVGLRQPVDSEAAQALWERYWAAQQYLPAERLTRLRELWVAAWTSWARDRERPW
ncbi:hypothetical protein C7C46_21200 [Streptomyces tateyamensis]|uniref:Uncharacterized protein n=1 Tax=Streptomyces tateyamensis TaxID=565073 RepID=A0A2V4NC65_9ACTN|nr:hypothetical protein [Streptomyces tateyamensis]PYC76710.1 hypothetical protein C7C46_21200 [Streptomyces tateyamensis]